MRELREELDVAGRVLAEVGRYRYAKDPGPCVVLLAGFAGEPRPNEELLALRWFTRDEVEAIGRAGLLQIGLELDAIARAEHEDRPPPRGETVMATDDSREELARLRAQVEALQQTVAELAAAPRAPEGGAGNGGRRARFEEIEVYRLPGVAPDETHAP